MDKHNFENNEFRFTTPKGDFKKIEYGMGYIIIIAI